MRLTKSRHRALSTICSNSRQVFLAASVAAIVFPLDAGKVLVILLYVILTLASWFFSIEFAERGKL